ncbi:MAG: hypothetical protein MUF54_13490 [Polyangiaceae bacterium]|nr:hypothetical protein [Polyangiaceae bacterium]
MGEVVVEHVVPNPAAGQQRLDAAAHALLPKPRKQRVDGRAPLLNGRLFRSLHVLDRHGHRVVSHIAVHALTGHGIDRPRVSLRKAEDQLHGARLPAADPCGPCAAAIARARRRA